MTLDSRLSPCPWVSCSLSAVTDLNNSLSQLLQSPRHGGANQLPRHYALRGGGERERGRQRASENAGVGGIERRTQEEGGGGRGRRGGAVLEKGVIWLEDKTLFLFFSCGVFFARAAFVFIFPLKTQTNSLPHFLSLPALSHSALSLRHPPPPNSPAVNMSPFPSLL